MDTYFMRAVLAFTVPLVLQTFVLLWTRGGALFAPEVGRVAMLAVALLGAALLPARSRFRWVARAVFAVVVYIALFYFSLIWEGYFYGYGSRTPRYGQAQARLRPR